MRVGYLGVGDLSQDVIFKVDSKVIETFSNMKMTKQVTYTTHKIHGYKAIPEMTGLEADTLTFEMILSAFMGVNPIVEMIKLEKFMRAGTICNLVLGTFYCGSWVIKSIPYDIHYVSNEGDITQIKITVSLIEAGGGK